MLKFSKANAKLVSLATVPAIARYLTGKRKVWSFDLLSGHTCPYAKDCYSKAVRYEDEETGKIRTKIVDGPGILHRCFSASQEALFPSLYNLREANGDYILDVAAKFGPESVSQHLLAALPKNAGVIRIHVGGDLKTRSYFEGWILTAKARPDILFYAYTKSLPFWVRHLNNIPDNFVLTASRGGHRDDLIGKHNLREAVVVGSEAEAAALNLPIDHDDSHAANPATRNQSFALLIHGPQPAGSKAAKDKVKLKGVGSYHRKGK